MLSIHLILACYLLSLEVLFFIGIRFIKQKIAEKLLDYVHLLIYIY